MGNYGRKELLERIGFGNTPRVSSAPEGIRRKTVDWNTVSGDVGERCLQLGTIMIPINANGKPTGLVGPYDPQASDGRQVVSRSNAFVLNETVCEKVQGSEPVEMFEKGNAYKTLLRVGGENEPTWTEFEMAFTQLAYIPE